jgi:hypothetical protein
MSQINHFKIYVLYNIMWQMMWTKWTCVLMWHAILKLVDDVDMLHVNRMT